MQPACFCLHISIIIKHHLPPPKDGDLLMTMLNVNWRTLPSQHIFSRASFCHMTQIGGQYTSCSAGNESQGFIQTKNFSSTSFCFRLACPGAISINGPMPGQTHIRTCLRTLFPSPLGACLSFLCNASWTKEGRCLDESSLET